MEMDGSDLPGAVEPSEWFVAFHTEGVGLWRFLARGKFKHVNAFAYCAGVKVWIWYDVNWRGVTLIVFPHAAAMIALPKLSQNCTLVKFGKTSSRMPLRSRFGYYCVPAIKHLIGLKCVSLTPTGLYASLLRNGGVVVSAARPAENPARSEPPGGRGPSPD